MNIYQRLNEVRKAVKYVQKDTNVQGQYNAVTHDKVTAAVREHFVTHGIVSTISLIPGASSVVDTGSKTSKGVPFIRYEATYQIRYINMDEPNDLVEMAIEAHAIDQGDKAPGKAMSYAMKYADLKILKLETGDDDESRYGQDADIEGGMSEKVLIDWRSKIDEVKTSKEGEEVWSKIKDACEKSGDDRQAATKLRAHLSVKLAAIKKLGAVKEASDSAMDKIQKEAAHA